MKAQRSGSGLEEPASFMSRSCSRLHTFQPHRDSTIIGTQDEKANKNNQPMPSTSIMDGAVQDQGVYAIALQRQEKCQSHSSGMQRDVCFCGRENKTTGGQRSCSSYHRRFVHSGGDGGFEAQCCGVPPARPRSEWCGSGAVPCRGRQPETPPTIPPRNPAGCSTPPEPAAQLLCDVCRLVRRIHTPDYTLHIPCNAALQSTSKSEKRTSDTFCQAIGKIDAVKRGRKRGQMWSARERESIKKGRRKWEWNTLVRRFWHSLQAVEALFILPSSGGRPLPPGGWLPPPPPPGGRVRGAMGL